MSIHGFKSPFIHPNASPHFGHRSKGHPIRQHGLANLGIAMHNTPGMLAFVMAIPTSTAKKRETALDLVS